MVVGVAGKYCAGKDAVVLLLKERAFGVIDEDRVGHFALEAKKESIIGHFGGAIRDDTGSINRKKLGQIVFSDQAELRQLEALIHPWMVEETDRQLRADETIHNVINAAILFRMKLHNLCDVVLLVDAPFVVRLFRGLRRDGLSFRQTVERVVSQRGDDIPKHFVNEKGAHVDTVVVRNGGSKRALSRRLEKILSKYGIAGRF